MAFAYVAAAVVFLLIDAVWLTLMADRLYRPMLGDMLAPSYRLLPAMLFYLIYIAGIVVLAILPALRHGDWTSATVNGAILGFVAYATYDLTNQATLRHWPVVVTIADLAWGTVLTAIASTCGYFAAKI